MSRKPISSEIKILKAIRTKGDAGWELLFKEFDPLIKAIVRWPVYNFTEEVQLDVCQNIHVHLQKAIPRFRKESSLSWYIKTIAKNQCVNEIRRQSRQREVITSSVHKNTDGEWHEIEYSNPDERNPHHALVQIERIETVRTALATLKSVCKKSITMFYLQQLTYQEMSERLGITQNTVGSRLSKCLDKLHKELRKLPQFEKVES